MSGAFVNSLHDFNEMSVRQVLTMKIIITLKRCDIDVTPNSHDHPTKKSMVLVGRINVSIVGIKGFKTFKGRLPFPESQTFALG